MDSAGSCSLQIGPTTRSRKMPDETKHQGQHYWDVKSIPRREGSRNVVGDGWAEVHAVFGV